MGSAGTFSETTFNQYIGVLEETVKQTSAAYVVCGGDWLNNGDTKAQAAAKLGFVDGKMRAMFPEKYYPIVGNHDYNYLGVDGDGNRLPSADWISVDAMRNFWFYDHEHCYYKFKRMTAQNYVLNIRTDHDGNSAYDQGQLDWLAANLIEDDPAHSTIMFHIYYLSGVGTTIPTRVVAVGKIIAAFNAHTICTLTTETEGYEKTYDFTGTSGHIDYSLVGHTHADFSDTFGGVPVIGCDNFTDGGESTFDLIFADYSVGKVYCTRIGTGASREFNI
jgi:predicted phosphodiesterase